jgi:hypothetical protein
MAACLEFFEIMGVIFLQTGHAFVGYWSTEETRKEFLVSPNPQPLMQPDDNAIAAADDEGEIEATEIFAQRYPWHFDRSRYPDINQAISSRKLVPIETTVLTQRGSFGAAVDQGVKNLEIGEDFESMLDIKSARDRDVTPLPIDYNR